MNGLILAQINHFKGKESSSHDYRYHVKNYADLWKQIFAMVEDHDMDEELTHNILASPDHKLVKALVYIYSMESFVFTEMN